MPRNGKPPMAKHINPIPPPMPSARITADDVDRECVIVGYQYDWLGCVAAYGIVYSGTIEKVSECGNYIRVVSDGTWLNPFRGIWVSTVDVRLIAQPSKKPTLTMEDGIRRMAKQERGLRDG